ncbi:hypothetical protein As57867_005767, partial [Aphanomyces stellatus]
MISDPAEYVLQSVFDIRGDFDFERLETCWKSLALETPLLRTVFVSTVHGLFQAVTNEDLSEWIMLPATWLSDEIDTLTKEYLDNDRQRGFTLMSKSYHRFAAARISDGRIRVFWTHHHSLMDGWSLQLVMDKLLSICYGEEYNATFVPFKDHIEWLAQQDEEPSRLFWESALANSDQSQQLALPKPHLDGQTSQTKYKALALTVPLPGMTSVCRKLGVTPSSVFRAAWSIVLQQYTRSEYVTFGSVVSGRDTGLDGVDKIIGMLINTVPIQVHVSTGGLTDDLIVDVHRLSTDIVQYSHCSLVDVKRWAKVAPEGQLFDTILVYENYPPSEMDKSKLRPFTLDFEDHDEFVDVNLGVAIWANGEDYSIRLTYNTGVLDTTIAEYLGQRFLYIMSEIVASKTVTVATLDKPMEDEQTLLNSCCYGPQEPLPNKLLHHTFEKRANVSPNVRAVEFDQSYLTYGELNAHANIVALKLSSIGVQVGSRVAVIMDRCLEFPVALLAVLKVGAAMVPMDASFPAARLVYMIQDAGVAAVVTKDDVEANNFNVPIVRVHPIDLPVESIQFQPFNQHIASTQNEAFIVYTSGSTGKPKGVPVLHASAVNVALHSAAQIGVIENARVLQFMAIGFDGFQADMWKCLSHGATLVLRGANSIDAIHTVDAVAFTPTALALLGHPSQYPNLKFVSVAGESCPATLKGLWSSYVTFMNLYGPSECAIMTHFTQLFSTSAVSIGKPIANVKCFVVDEKFRQVPVGVVGELYLGGMCLSPGYINLDEQTHERFVNDPFDEANGKLFRTADLCRLLPSGNFEILGRNDTQVKLKGYRIELDEVADAIMQHPSVTSAAALVKDKSHLVGYFSPVNVNVEELQQIVSDHLPVYMVPAVWVALETMPQNSNGKIDKKALAELDVVVEVSALETETEKQMAAIWADVLNVDVNEIGRDTSFFAMGGDSISVIKVIAACKNAGLSISAAAFLHGPVLSRVASAVAAPIQTSWPSSSLDAETSRVLTLEWKDMLDLHDYSVYPVTPLQGGMLYETLNNRSAYVNQISMQLNDDFDAQKLCDAFKILVESHDILRTTFVTTSSGIFQVVRKSIDGLIVPTTTALSINDFLELDLARGFEIGEKYFVRLTIVEVSNERFAVMTIHHALYDGWTISMLFNDLFDIVQGNSIAERPSFTTVVDFIEGQNKDDTEAYWRSYLAGVVSSPLVSAGSKMTGSTDDADTSLSIFSTTPLSTITSTARQVGVTVAELCKLAWAAT